MKNERAAEARYWAQVLDNDGGIRDPTTAEYLLSAADAIDALEIVANGNRATMEQWEASFKRERERAERAEARLREYEEALGKQSETPP